ncbi:MAG: DUF4293 domain-containing protein [Alistipes sp.]|nr:DUF4293 domain-containing protein [Alistipes sp.]
MIQRIQSLYLLLVAVLATVAMCMPLAWFANSVGEFRLYAFALCLLDGDIVQLTLCMGLSLLFAALLPVVTICYFRRRLLQLRLCIVEAVLLLGALIMEGIYYYLCVRIFNELPFLRHGFFFAAALPVVCLLFVGLAARAVWRDEALVRAADRIR